MSAAKKEKLQGVGLVLLQDKVLEEDDALKFTREARVDKTPLTQYLVQNGIIAAELIAKTLSQSFGIPLMDLDCVEPDALPVNIISEKLMGRHKVLPLMTRGNHLFVAIDDPSRQSTLKEIQFHTGLHVNPIVVETDKLCEILDNLIHQKEDTGLADYLDDSQDFDELEVSADEQTEDEIAGISTEDAPIVKFVNRIFVEAIKKGVSDIHFEPYEGEYRIRYRQDGILNEVSKPSISLATRIAARIKIMSNLDISERRIPQDGRFKLKISRTKSIDFRVNTCPTIGGEKVVARILDPGSLKLGIEELGFNKKQEELFSHAISRPQGLILVTGPTGSGKTVTLYTAINILNTTEKNISTAEDPVEIKLQGINQVTMNPKAGLDFAGTLRAFLRQDPDIIMVGEVRDLETANIAINAAQTGHLVLTTLHTNSAAETLTRLVNMGVATFNIASSVNLIMAQRLVRRLCENCKKLRDDTTPESLVELGFTIDDSRHMETYKAVGCKQCANGYKGRVGIFEVMALTKEIGHLIMINASSQDILDKALKQGMSTLYQSGLEKIKLGLTTIEEINRITVE